jgi:hypothetical protein
MNAQKKGYGTAILLGTNSQGVGFGVLPMLSESGYVRHLLKAEELQDTGSLSIEKVEKIVGDHGLVFDINNF